MTDARDSNALVTIGELERLAEFALDQGGEIADIGNGLMLGLARLRRGDGLTLDGALGLARGPTGTWAQRHARQVRMIREAAKHVDRRTVHGRAKAVTEALVAAKARKPRFRPGLSALDTLCGEICELGINLPGFEAVRKMLSG